MSADELLDPTILRVFTLCGDTSCERAAEHERVERRHSGTESIWKTSGCSGANGTATGTANGTGHVRRNHACGGKYEADIGCLVSLLGADLPVFGLVLHELDPAPDDRGRRDRSEQALMEHA